MSGSKESLLISKLGTDGMTELAELMLGLCPDGIILITKDSLVVTVANEQALSLLSCDSGLLDNPLPFELSPQQPQEVKIERDGRDDVYLAVKRREVEWNQVQYWLLSIRDITARVRLREQLKTEALIDELTGLYNRRGFLSLGEHSIRLAEREKRKLTVVFVDLDDMKQINDVHGHKCGDDALQNVAEILKRTFRKSDILARLGGDEFAVIAHNKERDDSSQIKLRLFTTLHSMIEKSNVPYRLSLSVGFAHATTGCNLDDLLEQADAAMYEEKQKRKNGRH